jgi:hypothetical protein
MQWYNYDAFLQLMNEQKEAKSVSHVCALVEEFYQ